MSILDRTTPEPDTVLSYAERDDAVLDIFLPAVPPEQVERVVFYVHGGFWRLPTDRTHARPLARALADQGAVVVLPEYRRVGGGGGWPTTCDDVRAALEQTPALLSGLGVRPIRTVLTGHSAGGHLTLWLAATGADAQAQVDSAVAIAPVADLRAADAIGMGQGAVRDFVGADADSASARAAWDAADPAELFDAHRPAHPVRILHGTADESVTIDNSRGLVARHPWIDLLELEGADHFAPIDPGERVFAEVAAALR